MLSLFLQLRSRSSPVRSVGTSPQESTMESSPAKAARWGGKNIKSLQRLTKLINYLINQRLSQMCTSFMVSVFVCLCIYRVSSVAVSRTMPCTLVPARGTAWSTELTVTAASTAAYRSVWLWAWAEMVNRHEGSTVLISHTTFNHEIQR